MRLPTTASSSKVNKGNGFIRLAWLGWLFFFSFLVFWIFLPAYSFPRSWLRLVSLSFLSRLRISFGSLLTLSHSITVRKNYLSLSNLRQASVGSTGVFPARIVPASVTAIAALHTRGCAMLYWFRPVSPFSPKRSKHKHRRTTFLHRVLMLGKSLFVTVWRMQNCGARKLA